MIKNKMLAALLAEYKKAADELKSVLNNISQEEFIEIKDFTTKDPDCHSIQTIIFHVVQSGYTYANYINEQIKVDWYEYHLTISSPQKGIEELDKMLAFTTTTFENIDFISIAEIEDWIIKSRWNVTYDFEQLMEHAIVHILRHRRQIEQFLKA